jgi:hypothetical protein
VRGVRAHADSSVSATMWQRVRASTRDICTANLRLKLLRTPVRAIFALAGEPRPTCCQTGRIPASMDWVAVWADAVRVFGTYGGV